MMITIGPDFWVVFIAMTYIVAPLFFPATGGWVRWIGRSFT